MITKRTFLNFSNAFIVLQLLSSCITVGESKNVFVNKCPGYKDTRISQINQKFIAIPNTRTSQIAYEPGPTYSNYSISFELKTHQRSEYPLLCLLDSTELKELTWTLPHDIINLHPRNFSNVSEVSGNRHPYSYFTELGYFYDVATGNYYDTDKYCVQSISDDKVKLQICAVNNDCINSSIPNLYCVPKCCALDETLSIWTKQCIRLNETKGRTPWELPVYEGLTNPNKLIKPSLIYHMAYLPEICNPLKNENGTIVKYRYYFVTASRVEHYCDPTLSYDRANVKFIVPNKPEGKLQILEFYNYARKWVVESFGNYCVDGFYTKAQDGLGYTGNQEQFVILFCESENDNNMWEEGNDMDLTLASWIYVGSSSISLLFLLATCIVYAIVWDKHNLHGLVIASYMGAILLGYIFLMIDHLLPLQSDSNAIELYDRDAFCYAVAILAHFFYLSTFFWLSILNFDLWLTFKSMKAKKRNTKEWKKFGIYSCVAWGFPLSLVVAFIIVNEVYRDPLSLVHVPDYGNGSCFVTEIFRDEYAYYPMAILLTLNFILISMTMWIFIKARNSASKLTIAGGMHNYIRYNAVFFIKLFTVMGGYFTLDFLTWYNEREENLWLHLALECLKQTSSIFLFFLFCLNDRVVGQLEEKYPRLIEKIRPFLQICLKKKTDVAQQNHGYTS